MTKITFEELKENILNDEDFIYDCEHSIIDKDHFVEDLHSVEDLLNDNYNAEFLLKCCITKTKNK